MAKFEKKPIPRGIKLYSADATQTQVDVASQLSNKQINSENFVNKSVPWRMTLAPGSLRPESFPDKNAAIPFPFTLIPPQELFNSGGNQAYSDVLLLLKGVTVSFDTKQEPAAIKVDDATIHAAVEAYGGIEVVITEKQQWYFDQSQYPHTPERVIFKQTLTPEDFAAVAFPLGQSDLSIQMSPYKTYAVQVSAPKVNVENNDTSNSYVLPNFIVSLRGEWARLPNTEITTAPDDDDPELANGPNRASSDNNDTVTMTVPAGGSTIDASVLNANLTNLDDKLFERIQGGYGPNSEMGRYGHTLETMGYDIIAVPLFTSSGFSGLRSGGGIPNPHEDVSNGPYYLAGANGFIYDRVVLPVAFPMEVHHVFCTWSVISPASTASFPTFFPIGTFPATSQLKYEVGVSMGTGTKSDWVAMDNIAALRYDLDPASPDYYQNYLIDRYRVKNYAPAMSFSGGGDVFMLQVPLMSYVGGQRGEGYYEQGKPVFVGRGNSWTSGRDFGAGAGTIQNARRSKLPEYTAFNNPVWEAASNGFADTRGMENFLEVAVRIEHPSGLENIPANSVITGHGGFWVYMVVKRANVKNVERIR